MREIKFRAWDGENVVYGVTSIETSLPLMQFTGLKDKNGNEIYEGDLCRREGVVKLRQVEFDTLVSVADDYGSEAYGYKFDNGVEKWEVVGNIYENPELLTPFFTFSGFPGRKQVIQIE